MARSEVLSGYNGEAYLSFLTEKVDNYTFTNSETFTIDNLNNPLFFPKIKITALADNVNIQSITNEDLLITIQETLNSGDILVLDFNPNKQRYTLNDNNIVDIIIMNSLLLIKKDKVNTFSIEAVGDYEVEITYPIYETQKRLAYVEGLDLSYSLSFDKRREYISNQIIGSDITNREYSFGITKFSINQSILDNILLGKEFKFHYQINNEVVGEEINHYLTGCKFNKYNYSYSSPDDIIASQIDGFAENLIKK